MRCAILKLASEPPLGLVRLLSPAIQETTDMSLSDPLAQVGALGGCIEERVLARLDRGENAGEGRGIWERGAEPEGTGDGEVPGFLAAAGTPRDPDVSWATRGCGRIGQVWIQRVFPPSNQQQNTGQVNK